MSTLITLLILAVAVGLLIRRLVRMIRQNGGEAPDAAVSAECGGGCLSCSVGCTTPIDLTDKRRPMILYYEDEELDRFRGRAADLYTEMETQEFRHVLRTLQDADVPGWVTSIHRRGIHFPAGVADEVTHRLSVVMNQ
ncbi:FeoB-associated Cys-rich membrane protein [Porphyromonas bennonis]|uniref:FeoB-associated Cys-rich membrane protein n=1 Tax=Porphyromonas bennonis TaxID=501496 RepID=UPI00036FBE76|nr:FeoB-associated Cys-rich membrane protein [Porphyromonas bennonis]